MGQIFSAEKVSRGEIPEAGAHAAAGRFILDRLFERKLCVVDESHPSYYGIDAAMIYGSTAMGRAAVRSDLDVLAIYAYPKDLPYFRNILIETEDLFHVPIEPQLYRSGALSTPSRHSIDPLYAQHLLEVQEMSDPMWSVNWPVDGLRNIANQELGEDYLRRLATGYAGGKARQLTRASLNYRGEVDTHDMQRALELPSAIGRKILPIYVEPEEMPDVVDKAEMIKKVRQVTLEQVIDGNERVLPYFDRLLVLDREYDELLAQVTKSQITIGQYEQWLQDHYLEAIETGVLLTNFWSDQVSYRYMSVAEWEDYQKNELERYTKERTEWLAQNPGSTEFDFDVYMLGVY